jgi:hypothetical protein
MLGVGLVAEGFYVAEQGAVDWESTGFLFSSDFGYGT